MWAEPAQSDWQEFAPEEASILTQLNLDSSLSEFVTTASDGTVTISVPAGQAATIPLGEYPTTAMQSRVYAVQMQVDHAVGSAPAYFEMWTSLREGGAFFSKTLGTQGPMRHLLGHETGRDVIIPASLEGSNKSATRCNLSLVLPAGGDVTIRKARMLDVPAGLHFLVAASGQWFPGWMGGVIGAVFGVACGCLGSLYRYSHRSGFLWNAMQHFPIALTAISAVILLAGIAALRVKQPYAVWYPLVLIGVLGSLGGPLLQWQTKRQAPQEVVSFEERQMHAMDL